jgi:2-iminobutanoate/2-iminopropanoate deaminase
MPRETITSQSFPIPKDVPISHGVRAGNLLFLSSFGGFDSATGRRGVGIEEQTRQALRNCELVLIAGGATLADVVDVLVLLRDPTDFVAMNAEYGKAFGAKPPARAVASLGADIPGLLVSIKMTALLPSSD